MFHALILQQERFDRVLTYEKTRLLTAPRNGHLHASSAILPLRIFPETRLNLLTAEYGNRRFASSVVEVILDNVAATMPRYTWKAT
jgi:hypothetical protein